MFGSTTSTVCGVVGLLLMPITIALGLTLPKASPGTTTSTEPGGKLPSSPAWETATWPLVSVKFCTPPAVCVQPACNCSATLYVPVARPVNEYSPLALVVVVFDTALPRSSVPVRVIVQPLSRGSELSAPLSLRSLNL